MSLEVESTWRSFIGCAASSFQEIPECGRRVTVAWQTTGHPDDSHGLLHILLLEGIIRCL